MNNTKKGFTLVELLVVIAILAILATVSVVGYTSFIDRANQSNAETEANQVKSIVEYALMDPTTAYVTFKAYVAEVKDDPATADKNEAVSEVPGIYVYLKDGKYVVVNKLPEELVGAKGFDASKDIPENGDLSIGASAELLYTTGTHEVNVMTGSSKKLSK